jgi:hypothetical protein
MLRRYPVRQLTHELPIPQSTRRYQDSPRRLRQYRFLFPRFFSPGLLESSISYPSPSSSPLSPSHSKKSLNIQCNRHPAAYFTPPSDLFCFAFLRVRDRSRPHIHPRILFLTSRDYVFVLEVIIVSTHDLPSKGRRKVVGTATTSESM